MSVMEPKKTELVLKNHLKRHELLSDGSQAWTVGYSSFGGRGLFANRDIEAGELIFVDYALLISPRNSEKYLPLCVSCYKDKCPLFSCDRGCGLPICSQICEDSKKHVDYECKYLRKLEPTCGSNWSIDLLRGLLAVRAITLDDEKRDVLAVFQCHQNLKGDCEVTLLRSNVKNAPEAKEIDFMMMVSGIFNTNSFETFVVQDKDHYTSLRGLYPLGALLNHACVPNTRHHYDSQQRLYVIAVRPISAGEEITMTYIDLFWDTILRRQVLSVTKNFCCRCKRCSDPTECGSLFGALYCAADYCSGILLPRDPLNNESLWTCNKCQISIKLRQINSIRSGLSSILHENISKPPRKLLKFLQRELSILVPPSNYLIAEIKYTIISYFGKIEDLLWADLSDDELAIKASFCTDLLSILNILGSGQCRRRGLLLYELYCTIKEQLRRLQGKSNFKEESLILFKKMNIKDNDSLLNEIIDIFQNDAVASTFLNGNL
ncbi:PREDICTED: protein msta, isoform B-like [Polistes canadensis]|uniref:protein msta, isoform B-like n=1 Tax=Polistes canadensis TaxID=91411 RepID=UPI000718F2BC|nr:PREDICTED: protein msta, isoform B-like [Polistes canadensis]